MNATHLYLLQRLRIVGDLNIRDVAKLLPHAFGDHRDFYPLAQLVEGGYVDVSVTNTMQGVQLLAISLYAWATKDGDFTYQGIKFSGAENFSEGVRLALTGKGLLALEEIEARRFDRLWTAAIAITAGFASAVVTALATNHWLK